MDKFSGGCLCGQVKYSYDGMLRHIIGCHCVQCRKTSGHFVAATQAEDTNKLKISGQVTWYQSSGDARRGFCGICGSNLFWQPGDRSKTSIFAGTLDSAKGLRMTEQIHVDSKGEYYDLPDVAIVDQNPI
jgi:hypothetical protein